MRFILHASLFMIYEIHILVLIKLCESFISICMNFIKIDDIV